jgi:hypothetical protein
MLAAKPDSPVFYQLAALDAPLGKWKEAEATTANPTRQLRQHARVDGDGCIHGGA